MKFAVVSDIHIGKFRKYKNIYRKNTRYSKKSLRHFVRKMNRDYRPDFVVNCGDMVEHIDQKHDEKNFAAGVKILSKLKCPVYHTIGNHDTINLSEQFLRATIERSELYYKIDTGEFRLIFLFTRQPLKPDGAWYAPYLDSSQLEWLHNAVKTDGEILIFCHASLVPVDTTGNFWFEDDPEDTYIKNHAEFLSIISGKNIGLVINGHLHWNKHTKLDGVNYITIQSLVENTSGKVKGPPANAYALVTTRDKKASIDIKGLGGIRYDFSYDTSPMLLLSHE